MSFGRDLSPQKLILSKSLRGTRSRAWPFGSLPGNPGTHFTIRMTDTYRELATSRRPDQQYQEAIKNLEDIQAIYADKSSFVDKIIDETIDESLIELIFGSNAIETVGTIQRVTYRLCKMIFDGVEVSPEDVNDRDPDYAAELEHAGLLGRPKNVPSIIRGRYEIIQHAKALRYLVQAIIIEKRPLTEHVIKDAHRILMQHSEHEKAGGVYRTGEEAAKWGSRSETEEEYQQRVAKTQKYKPGFKPERLEGIPLYESKFVRGPSVPIYMSKLVEQYNKDIADAETTGIIDPMGLAAKHCHLFVCIHPFEDGNGRVCRLLLNIILLKYTGVTVSIGLTPAEREDYIRMTTAANKMFGKEEQQDVPWEKQKSFAEFGTMITGKVGKKLQQLKQSLGGVQE